MRATKATFVLFLTIFSGIVSAQSLDEISSIPDSLIDLRMTKLEEYIATNNKDSAKAMEARLALAKEYTDMRLSDQAIEELNKALAFYKSKEDSSGIAKSLFRISEAYSSIQDYTTALGYVLECLEIATDAHLIKDLHHRLGYLYFNLQQFDSARSYFKKSIVLHEKLGVQPISSLLMLTGLSLAEENYDQALTEFLSIENRGLQDASLAMQYLTYKFISAIYLRKGNRAGSAVYLQKIAELGEVKHLERDLDFLETLVVSDTVAGDYRSAVANQLKYTTQLRSYYKNDLIDQLANYQKLYELKEKENAIGLLEAENQLYELKQKESRSYMIILFLGILVLILFLVLSYRILVIRTHTNKELKLLNRQISNHREDLSEKNELLKQTIKELQGTQNQLIQSEKMASIGTFVSGVAHELNNPINILNGGLQVIERNLREMEPDQDKKHRELIEDINVMLRESSFSITKINRIIQALVIATYTDRSPVEVDFSEIIDNVKLAFRSSDFLNTKFIQEIESVKFKCFPNRIHHAIKAVLENAFYYAALSEKQEKIVKITVAQEQEELVLKIENNGPKIPETDLLKIFDPFYTTKDDGESPGLGLYFAFSAVTEHDGQIFAKNVGQWVVMNIRFPLTKK